MGKRTHNPKWKDNTRNQRIQERRKALAEAAKTAGFESWSAVETAILNSKAMVVKIAD